MNFILGVLGQFLLFFVLTTYMILALIPAALTSGMPLRKGNRIVGPIWIMMSRIILFFSGTRMQIADRRKENQGEICPPGVVISNHLSMFDIPLIYSQISVPPIMKKEVLRIPIFGFLGKLSGALPVDRKNADSRKKVLFQAIKRILDYDFGILYFPEGTRSRDGRPKDFDNIKTKILQIAFKNNVPVFPTSLYGTPKVLGPIGNFIANQRIGMILHNKVKPADFQNEEDFIHACWGKVIEGYEELESSITKSEQNNRRFTQLKTQS